MRRLAVLNIVSLAFLWGCTTASESTESKKPTGNGEAVYISEQEMAYYKQFGQHIVADAQGKIFRKLSEVLTALGPATAVQFCKTNAKVLTGEFGIEHEVSIRRATDKVRNPYNRATPQELEKIAIFKKFNAENAQSLPPVIVVAHDKTVDYYAPIKTNILCLNCHGPKETLDPELLKRLGTWYPLDQATGYGINEIRGLWHVTFPKPQVVAKTTDLAKENAIKDATKVLGPTPVSPAQPAESGAVQPTPPTPAAPSTPPLPSPPNPEH